MVKSNAEKFIKEISKNNDFRKSFYTLEGTAEIMTSIEKAGYNFEIYEFEESINNLKTSCATEEDAIMLDELLLWWQMLIPYEDLEYSSKSCTPADCASCSSCG